MNNIIIENGKNFITFLLNFFGSKKIRALDESEDVLLKESLTFSLKMLRLYYENIDKNILDDKLGRKKVGYTVERKGDSRRIMSKCGEFEFKRTYYRNGKGKYEYLLDNIIEADKHERVILM